MPEVQRVLCDNGVMAVTAYMDMRMLLQNPEQEAQMDQLFEEVFVIIKLSFVIIIITVERNCCCALLSIYILFD